MKYLYYFPSASRTGYSNPYSMYYKKALEPYYNVLERNNTPANALSWIFLKNSFIADVFILNWLENTPYLRWGLLQSCFVLLGLKVIQWRNKKVVWMFHNIHPHQGNNQLSKIIQNILLKHSTLIISHSQEAAEYAYQKAGNKVIYKCHPISTIEIKPYKENIEKCDVLIWGTILPYKGIYEFISDKNIRQSNLIIKIIGKCTNYDLLNKIESQCNEYITFENRHIDFDELNCRIEKSKYILFPYIGDCVSSSGALIDTIVLGGIPVGPHKGAFKDLKKEGVCITYHNEKELINILNGQVKLEQEHIKEFILKNSWESFAKEIAQLINK